MENTTNHDISQNDQDPDYSILFNSGKNHQNIFEKNARANTAKKISAIIETEFLNEINNKKVEIRKIYNELSKACKMLHYLRFAIVTDFYKQENTLINDPQQSAKQSRLHCTVNAPVKSVPTLDVNFADNCLQELNKEIQRKRKIIEDTEDQKGESKKKCLQNVEKHISKDQSDIMEVPLLIGGNYKIKRRIIVGNISKWIPPDLRENNASHKWTIYIRDSEKRDLGQFISKVRFFLHPSYKPNDLVELTSPPFHLARHGWGEFPARVQLHFSNGLDKPVDIIHNLKLDRTFTGLQTIGSETVVDLWLTTKDTPAKISQETRKSGIVLSNNKRDYTIDNQKEKEKEMSENITISENKTIYQHFFTDHDYIVTNVKYDAEPFSQIKETQNSQNQINNSQNSIIKTEMYSSYNLKNNSAVRNFKENPRTLLKINQNKTLLISNFHASTQNQLLTKTKFNTDNAYSILKCSNKIDDKKIYLKNSDHVTSEECSKALVNLINYTKPSNLQSLLKFVAHRIPIITEKCTDPYYKLLHPYASESYEVFSNYSNGKQRSLEKYRAMYALEVMKNTKYFNDICNAKEFITWTRRYCYTPYVDFKTIHKMCTSIESIKLKDDKEKYRNSSTISNEINKWLNECRKINPNIQNDMKDDDQIDIVNISSSSSNNFAKDNSIAKKNLLIFMEYPENQSKLNEFVCRSAQKIGIKLTNEEIIPGVLHSSASLLIAKAVECLIDDILRLAFACSLDKLKTEEETISIEADDVHAAMLKKDELLIFTNAGLGSQDF